MNEPRSQSAAPLRLAVLVSGSGTTLQNLLDETAAGRLHADVRLVIGSRGGLRGVQRGIDSGVPTHVVDRKQFLDVPTFSRRVFDLVDAANVDLVCLAGWLCLLDLPDKWNDRVMNIH